MKTMLSMAFVAMSLLALPASAQDAVPGIQTTPPLLPPAQQDSISPGADAPQPLTGELVPLPVAPPEGQAARIKLPNCAPPNCGVPQIMAE